MDEKHLLLRSTDAFRRNYLRYEITKISDRKYLQDGNYEF